MGGSASIMEEPDDIIKNIHKTANALTDIYIENVRAIDGVKAKIFARDYRPKVSHRQCKQVLQQAPPDKKNTSALEARLVRHQAVQQQVQPQNKQQIKQQVQPQIKQQIKQQVQPQIKQIKQQEVQPQIKQIKQQVQPQNKQIKQQVQPMKQQIKQQIRPVKTQTGGDLAPLPPQLKKILQPQSLQSLQSLQDFKPDPLDFNERPFNVCNHIDEFYKKQLLNLKKVNLLYIAENLELKQDKESKAGICEAIIEHFQNRMILIKTILDSLPYCSIRIENFKGRGYCSNFDPSLTQEECEGSQNEWTHVDDVISSNKNIIGIISRMKEKYNKDLKRLLAILTKVKSDKTINSYTLDKLSRDADAIIENMFITCDGQYRPIVKSIIDSSNAARLDALRLKEGLKPYMEPLPKV